MRNNTIPEAMKTELAKENGKLREHYIQRVTDEGKKSIRPEEENARLRKAVYMLLTYMQRNHPEIADEAAFKEMVDYFGCYENIKETVRKELGMEGS